MKKVFYGLRASSELGNFFEDNNNFTRDFPYVLRVKHFLSDDIVPFHCGKTIEILFCDNLNGSIIIDNKSYELKGKQVFIIPPNVIHSTSIFKCPGSEYVLQISLQDISAYLNLVTLLEYCGCKLETLSYTCPETDNVERFFNRLIENDDDFCTCIGIIAELFSIFSKYKTERTDIIDGAVATDKKTSYDILRNVLEYTVENYDRPITLDEISSVSGYSKYYFCNWFKSLTGLSYFSHLTDVRNMYACLLLKSGKSVTECCHACGFSNISYFVQQFKKKYKVTPLEYAKLNRVEKENNNSF